MKKILAAQAPHTSQPVAGPSSIAVSTSRLSPTQTSVFQSKFDRLPSPTQDKMRSAYTQLMDTLRFDGHVSDDTLNFLLLSRRDYDQMGIYGLAFHVVQKKDAILPSSNTSLWSMVKSAASQVVGLAGIAKQLYGISSSDVRVKAFVTNALALLMKLGPKDPKGEFGANQLHPIIGSDAQTLTLAEAQDLAQVVFDTRSTSDTFQQSRQKAENGSRALFDKDAQNEDSFQDIMNVVANLFNDFGQKQKVNGRLAAWSILFLATFAKDSSDFDTLKHHFIEKVDDKTVNLHIAKLRLVCQKRFGQEAQQLRDAQRQASDDS